MSWGNTEADDDQHGAAVPPKRVVPQFVQEFINGRPVEPTPEDWWEDCGNIAALIRWLYDRHNFVAEDLIPIVEKPWKWDDMWKLMQEERCRTTS